VRLFAAAKPRTLQKLLTGTQPCAIIRSGGIIAAFTIAIGAHAETFDECLLHATQSATATTTVGELRRAVPKSAPITSTANPYRQPRTPPSQRHSRGHGRKTPRTRALQAATIRFVLTPHRPNYLLPIVYTADPNQSSFNSDENLQHTEVQFQLSLKVRVAGKSDRQQRSSVSCLH